MNITQQLQRVRAIAQEAGEWQGELAPQWCGIDGEWLDVWTLEEPPVASRAVAMRTNIETTFTGIAYGSKETAYELGKLALIEAYNAAFADAITRDAERFAGRSTT